MPKPWTVLSNHGIALVCVAREPGLRMRDIADCMGVSDRTAFGVVEDLVKEGYLRRWKEGNRNRYEVNPVAPLRHPTIDGHWVGEILAVLVPESIRRSRPSAAGDTSTHTSPSAPSVASPNET